MSEPDCSFANGFPHRTNTGGEAGGPSISPPPLVPAILGSSPSSAHKQARSRIPRKKKGHNIRRMLWVMVLVAFGIRLVVALCTYQDRMNPVMTYWLMGQEEGHVAASIVQGHGFGNPLYTQTGPTAWFAPVYPYILAGFFEIFGTFTAGSCIAILCFDAIVSSLTCLPIFFFTRRTLGEGAALAAGWTWVVYPYAVYWPVYRIWDTWLTTLLLAILFSVILKLEHSAKMKHWIGFGLLAGFAALVDPIVMGVLPLLALWAAWRLRKQGKRWLVPGFASIIAVLLVVTPWTVRNYQVFHKIIPIRDNLPLEFRVGNNGDSSEPLTITAGPWVPWINNTEWNEYTRMGELAYFHLKGEQAKAYIEAHPLWYAGMIARRFLYVWTGFWSFSHKYMADPDADHKIDFVTVPLLTLLSVLTFMGLARAYRQKGPHVATPYATVLIFFPLIYYLTHVGGWYRCPMEPMIIPLAAYEVHSRVALWLGSRKKMRGAEQVALSEPERVSAMIS